MVPSGPMVGEAPEPMPLAPPPPPGAPAAGVAVTSGVGPRCSPKSNVQRTLPSSPAEAGGAIAYSLPSVLGTYTLLASLASAGEPLSVGPAMALQRSVPFGATANRRPEPPTM